MRNVFFLAAIPFFSSCEKDEPIEPQTAKTPASIEEYYPLSIGNYWIYQQFIYENGTKTVGRIDSTVITNDTLIDGKKYYVLRGTEYFDRNWGTLKILRDSAGYIISPRGYIYFCTNLNDTIYNYEDEFYSSYTKMVIPDDSIRVPAGTFKTMDRLTTISFGEGVVKKYTHNYYVKNVEPIMQTFIYAGSDREVRSELLRYHIQ